MHIAPTGHQLFSHHSVQNKGSRHESMSEGNEKHKKNELTNNNLKFEYNEKVELLEYKIKGEKGDSVSSELSYISSSTSVNFSFDGSIEDSRRLLYANISQKLESFQMSSDGTQFNHEYSSFSGEVSFENFEDSAKLIISKISQAINYVSTQTGESQHDALPANTPETTSIKSDVASIKNTDPNNKLQTTLEAPSAPVNNAPVINTTEDSANEDKPATQSVITIDPKPRKKRKGISAIQHAVKKGIKETKDAVKQYGTYSADFAKELSEIRKRIDDLLKSYSQPTNTINAQYLDYSTSSNTSVQIETNDGDIISINLSNQQQGQYSSGVLSGNGFSAESLSALTASDKRISYSVEGELDEEELKAIENLVAGISDTVNRYAQGDVDAALDLASNLKLDTSELSAFQFETQSSTQYKTVNVYQQLGSNTAPTKNSASLGGINSPPTHQHEISNRILDLLSQANESNIAQPLNTVSQLTETFYQQLEIKAEQNNVSISYAEQSTIESINTFA